MSTLTGNKISLTYKSLFKTSDNDVLTAALKQMSDGLGNNSGVYLNTGGDLKSTGTLEFANFKGTSTAVTINKLVNEADGISNNDNDTSLPTSAAVKDYVDTHVTSQDLDFSDGTTQSAVDLDSQVFAIVGTTNEIETTASGQQLQIGLPNSVTISGTYTGSTFSGDLNGTINTATTATTQSAGDNSTKVATTAYVDTLDAASDLDFSGTTGTGDVNLNTQTFAVTGTTNQITTAASNQGLQISLLSTGVTMPNNSVATTQSAGDNSTKLATTAYVDVLDAASDLDIAGDSGTGDVNLNTQTFTLSGTTNQVTTAVSGQTATFSLPSTIHRNLQGNVTGDLTGNADTATKWQTARNLSVSGEATGTISNVDGSSAVSGAVTLTNSAVIGKVLTGLPTPAAGNIQASDSILEAFGKLQSQVSSISNGLIFKGSWDADTNTPTLISGGGEVESGTTDGATTAFKLIDSSQNFNTTVSIGNKVINQVDGTTALVTVIDSNTQLTLDTNIMLTGEAYTIDASPFIAQGNYYVVNYAGNTNLNGTTDWSIGDWVIADADNRWSKLDHSQVDGQGSPGHLPVFATATTIGDSIVSQVGTALTITGSASTTLGLSSTGNFAVNTNKFTANATTGNTAFAGDLAINTDKFTVNATSGNTVVAGDLGIGVTATKALQVSGEALFGNGTDGLLLTYSNGNSSGIIDTGFTSTALEFRTGGSERLTINSSTATFAGHVFVEDGNKFFGANAVAASSEDGNYVASFGRSTSGSAKFAGNITVGSGTSTFAGAVSSVGNITTDGIFKVDSAPDNNVLEVDQSGRKMALKTSFSSVASGNFWVLKTSTGLTNGTMTDALIVRPQEATFAGDVKIGNSTTGTPSTNANDLVIDKGASESGITLMSIAAASIRFGDAANTSIGSIEYNHNSNYMRMIVNNAERMHIDSSGNVGIGGGTIEGKLSIDYTAAELPTSGTTSNSAIQVTSSLNNQLNLGLNTVSGNYGAYIQASDNNLAVPYPLNLQPNGGNVGINANDPVKTLDVRGSLAISNSASSYWYMDRNDSTGNFDLNIDTNVSLFSVSTSGLGSFVNTSIGDKLLLAGDDAASARGLMFNCSTTTNQGDTWDIDAQSSTGIIKFSTGSTEKMRISSLGVVSVGTTSPITDPFIGTNPFQQLQVGKSGVMGSYTTSAGEAMFANNIYVGSTHNTFQAIDPTLDGFGVFCYNTSVHFKFADTQGNGTQTVSSRLTVDSASVTVNEGDLFLGTTSSKTGTVYFWSNANDSRMSIGNTGSAFEIRATYLSTAGYKPIDFYTSDSLSMRITSGGDVLIGKNTSDIEVVGFRIDGVTKGRTFASIVNTDATYYVRDTTNTLYRFYVTGAGQIHATSTSITAISDITLKENIKPLETGLDEVMKLQPRRFDWKNGDEKNIAGFVAQEVEEVLPDLVSDYEYNDEETKKALKMGDMIPTLVNAIQELKAEVDKLKQECKCK